MQLKGSEGAKRRAKRARRQMSPAEIALWRELRKSPGGFHFRRQHPAGEFDLDFFCAPANLAIEVDGAFHDRGHQPARDEARDRWIAEHGVVTLRVPAKAVFTQLDDVLAYIVARASARQPPRPPR